MIEPSVTGECIGTSPHKPRVEVRLDEDGRPSDLLLNGVSVPGVLDVAVSYKAGHAYRQVTVTIAAAGFVEYVRSPKAGA